MALDLRMFPRIWHASATRTYAIHVETCTGLVPLKLRLGDTRTVTYMKILYEDFVVVEIYPTMGFMEQQ